jgi:uncharacterized protein
MRVQVPFDDPAFLQLCEELNISYVGLFGSISRGEGRPGSDLDLLVSFSAPKSLLDIIGAQRKLKEFLGQDVDLVTEGGLKPRVRERIMRDLVDVYGSR